MLTALLDVYHVSPAGNDANDGRSPAAAWKTVAKVNAAPFRPGDRTLFARGGEWRECLKASSSGAPGKPIVYEAYGTGPKPKFWGSDVVGPDFVPKPGSPAFGVAKLGQRPTTDAAGRPRPAGPCAIGAYEPR